MIISTLHFEQQEGGVSGSSFRDFEWFSVTREGSGFCFSIQNGQRYEFREHFPPFYRRLPVINECAQVSNNCVLLNGEDGIYYFDPNPDGDYMEAVSLEIRDYWGARGGVLMMYKHSRFMYGRCGYPFLLDAEPLPDNSCAPIQIESSYFLDSWDPVCAFPKFSGEDDAKHKIRVGSLVSPVSIPVLEKEMHEKFDISFGSNSFSLKQLVAFFTYYETLDELDKERIARVIGDMDWKLQGSFIGVFEIFAGDLENCKKLLTLVETRKESANIVLVEILSLLQLSKQLQNYDFDKAQGIRDEIVRLCGNVDSSAVSRDKAGVFMDKLEEGGRASISEEIVDLSRLHALVYCYALRILDGELEVSGYILDPELMPRIIKNISLESILRGAASRAMHRSCVEQIEEVIPELSIEMFLGGEVIENAELGAMNDPENYLKPEVFGSEDFKRTCECFHAECTVNMTKAFAEDLTSPDITYVTLNWTEEYGKRKVIGIMAITPEGDSFHLKTGYVQPEYRSLNVGRVMEKILTSIMPPGSTFTAESETASTILTYNIEVLDFAGINVFSDKKDDGGDCPLMALRRGRFTYASKNRDVFTDEVIVEIAEKGYIEGVDLNLDNIGVRMIDCEDSLHSVSKEYFERGYVLTRAIAGGSLLFPGYFVFERVED